MLAIKDELEAKYAALVAERRVERQRQFDALGGDPAKEIDFSFQLFLRKYFLSDEGEPEPERTPHPIVLTNVECNFFFEQFGLKAAGLARMGTTLAWGDDKVNVRVIGWNEAEVEREMDKWVSDTKAARLAPKIKPWAERLTEHDAYVSSVSEEKKEKFRAEHASGAYMIHCPALEEGWPHRCTNMSMTFKAHGRLGLFAGLDLGIIYACAMLSDSREDFVELRRILEEEYLDESDYSDDYEGPSTKKKARTVWKAVDKMAKSHSTSKRGQSSRSQADVKPKWRFLLHWRGITARSEKMLADESVKTQHKGYLDFLDRACMRFEGQIDIPFIGEGLVFTGYKISDDNDIGLGIPSWQDYESDDAEIFHDSDVNGEDFVFADDESESEREDTRYQKTDSEDE